MAVNGHAVQRMINIAVDPIIKETTIEFCEREDYSVSNFLRIALVKELALRGFDISDQCYLGRKAS